MRIFIQLCFLFLLLIKCTHVKKPRQIESFQSFDFTYNDVFSTCFSIKFSQSDTILIRQHFASFFSDSLKSNTSYYALLSDAAKITLDSFMNALPLSSYETKYYQEYQDGIDYQFYIEKDTIKKLIRVHSNSIPSSLISFKDWIVEMKQELLLQELDSTIYFESEKFVVPPPIPLLPTEKFKVPTVAYSF